MNTASKHIATALIGALWLVAAAASSASANYTGLADGNPAPVDIWAATHPEFGRVVHSQHETMQGGNCEYLHRQALENGTRHMWRRYRACANG